MRKTEGRKSTTDERSRFKWPTYENFLSLFPHIFIFVLFVSSGEKRTTGKARKFARKRGDLGVRLSRIRV